MLAESSQLTKMVACTHYHDSGRFRLVGRDFTAGLMAYGNTNAVAMKTGKFEVLPIVEKMYEFYLLYFRKFRSQFAP